jgi:predicted O-linked N-acetylglucosamine transferase (SPINDLY family)
MWFTILKQVPDSQLMLQDENPTTTANLKSYAKKQHVDPDRFVFLPHLSYPNFLHKIAEIDLALDSTYYNGGSTTADLLYAGVPVITLAGHLYVERMGAAILTAAGLPELITHTRKAYINLAVSLANNPKELKLLKQRNFQNSKLFNTKLWVQNLELGLEAIWARYLQDLPPDHITITI